MIDKRLVRAIIRRHHQDEDFAAADIIWDLYDAYLELEHEMALKHGAIPETPPAPLLRANHQDSEIAGQHVTGCLSHYRRSRTGELVRCQKSVPGHTSHFHYEWGSTGPKKVSIWDDEDAFTAFKSEPTS